jgi:hypothetical protein
VFTFQSSVGFAVAKELHRREEVAEYSRLEGVDRDDGLGFEGGHRFPQNPTSVRSRFGRFKAGFGRQNHLPEGKGDSSTAENTVVSKSWSDLMRPFVAGFVSGDEQTSGDQCQLEDGVRVPVPKLDLTG